MYDPGDDDVVTDQPEIQCIWKVRDDGSTLVALDLLKSQRELTNPFDRRVDRISKPLAKGGLAFFEPTLGLEQLTLGSGAKNYLAIH